MTDGACERDGLLWDDIAFVRRVNNLALDRGLTTREVCRSAGLAPDYLGHPARRGGRSIEALLKIAKALNVGLADLTGVASAAASETEGEPPIPEDAIKRLALVADIAAHLYVALSARGVAPPRAEGLVGEILQMVGRAA